MGTNTTVRAQNCSFGFQVFVAHLITNFQVFNVSHRMNHITNSDLKKYFIEIYF